MRKDFGSKTWLYPMPVLIVASYDAHGLPNAMNAAWGGIYTDNTVGICLAEDHKTTQNILATKSFTVSVATVDHVSACDYLGLVSGVKVPDKLQRVAFHTIQSKHVNAPIIEELPMTLECEMVSYDIESNHLVGFVHTGAFHQLDVDAVVNTFEACDVGETLECFVGDDW